MKRVKQTQSWARFISAQTGETTVEPDEEDEEEESEKDDNNSEEKDTETDPLYKIKKVNDDKQKLPKNKGWEWVGKHPFRCITVGESGSGKTTLLIHLLNTFYAKYFDEIWIWSPNYHIDSTWKNLKFKPKRTFTTFEEEHVTELREQQTSVINREGVLRSKKILAVVDDFANDWQAMHSKGLQSFYTIGRHWNCSIFVMVQKLTAISLTMRTNASLLFCFHASNGQELETLRDEQTSQLITKKEFVRLFNEATTRHPYGFLTINHQAKPDEIYRFDLRDIQRISLSKDELEDKEKVASAERRKRLRSATQGSETKKSQPVAPKEESKT